MNPVFVAQAKFFLLNCKWHSEKCHSKTLNSIKITFLRYYRTVISLGKVSLVRTGAEGNPGISCSSPTHEQGPLARGFLVFSPFQHCILAIITLLRLTVWFCPVINSHCFLKSILSHIQFHTWWSTRFSHLKGNQRQWCFGEIALKWIPMYVRHFHCYDKLTDKINLKEDRFLLARRDNFQYVASWLHFNSPVYWGRASGQWQLRHRTELTSWHLESRLR